MSRRKSPRGLPPVEVDVQSVATSSGPCLGRCNRGYRRRVDQWWSVYDDHFNRASGALALEAEKPGQMISHQLEDELHTVAAAAADEQVRIPTPKDGAPVWCGRCSSDFVMALDELPGLLQQLVRTSAPDPVDVTVDVHEVSFFLNGTIVDHLACGHDRHRKQGEGLAATRECVTCAASRMVPEPGRLAPPPVRVDGAAAPGRSGVSPAGSPAWLEIDAALTVIGEAADTAKCLLGVDRSPRPATSAHSAQRRFAADCAFLVANREQLLALSLGPGPILEDVRETRNRLRVVCGDDGSTEPDRKVCPRCQRIGVESSSLMYRCVSCWATWTDEEFQRERDIVNAGSPA